MRPNFFDAIAVETKKWNCLSLMGKTVAVLASHSWMLCVDKRGSNTVQIMQEVLMMSSENEDLLDEDL